MPEIQPNPLELESSTAGNIQSDQDSSKDDGIADLLYKAGFDENLLSQIKSWTNWGEIKELSLADALKHITIGLTDRYKSNQEKSITKSVALIGTPGSEDNYTMQGFSK